MIFTSRQTDPLLLAVLYAFTLTLMIAPLTILFAKKTGLIDFPNAQPHKRHKHPVPIAGGLALFLSILFTVALLRREFTGTMAKILIPGSIVFALGLLDDYRPIRPKHKALGQCFATLVMILLGVQVRVFESLLSLEGNLIWISKALDILTTFFWMVFIINAVNLIDSADGLAVGVSNNTMIFCILLTMDTGQWPIAYFCGIMLGAGIVIHLFNTTPARLFLGDSGAQLIGFFLAVIAILYNPPAKVQASTWFVPILMLALPIFDTVLVIYARWRRHSMFYSGGTDHTYHRLVELKLSPAQSVGVIQMAAIGLQILALFMTSKDPLFANVLFFAIVIAGVCVVLLLTEGKNWLENKQNEKGNETR